MGQGETEDFDREGSEEPRPPEDDYAPARAQAYDGPRGGLLFGMSGSTLVGGGILLLVIAVVLFLVGGSYLMSGPAMPPLTGNFQQDQQAPAARFAESQAHAATGFGIFATGMVCFGIGAVMLRYELIRPVASYVATEASPAIQTVSQAVARGFESARPDALASPVAPQTVVKVKCKNCGYLDSEDATYCSKCGKPL